MEEDKIKKILENIKNIKVAVFGDFCLDAQWILDPVGSEISVETGLKGEAISRHSYALGGASNIVANLATLGPKIIYVVGVIGDDIFGREIIRQFERLKIDNSYFITEKFFSTVAFGKKYLNEKELPRLDFGFFNKRNKRIDNILLEGIHFALNSCDVLIFNQQIPGSLTDYFIEKVNELFNEFSKKIVILDTRHYGGKIKNTYIKANTYEAALLNKVNIGREDNIDLATVKKFGEYIYNLYKKPVFITRGARGIVVFDSKGFYEVLGIHLYRKLDRTGAGDTTISSLALCLAAGENPRDSAKFANLAASVVVQKLFQAGTTSPKEILELGKEIDYIYEPEVAEDYRKAKYIDRTEIELCYSKKDIQLGKIKHAVFDNDGTISTLRESWERVMEPVMMNAILGDQYSQVDENTFVEVQQHVRSYINNSTGLFTLIQMEALVEMVKYYGFIPKSKILDNYGYKQIYNHELMKFVNKRIDKIKSGELAREDFMIKGAIEFLKALKVKGVRLYLVSGTDNDDTLNESKILGYSGLFDGGVFGASHDIKKFSKKMIIEKIISGHNLKGPELVIFGDGPVEMRESRRSGGIAVGIASDEMRGYGLNLIKRTRLIKGGARIIIPDYTQTEKIINFLFPG